MQIYYEGRFYGQLPILRRDIYLRLDYTTRLVDQHCIKLYIQLLYYEIIMHNIELDISQPDITTLSEKSSETYL